ncbi:unnamed protein product [Rhizoctonia solani]|uniref:Putative 5'-nucleotidase C-terminal domain-containing protein n=1 Tax=Rhizoctonia solani TaxID=456999 RepID=A0A8H3DN94_9AGAM|nr:unnamed protein product [Rhizoctonia solani]
MRAILFGALGVVGLAVANPVPLPPGSGRHPIPFPTRPLEWGDVNVLHTTDIHGWLSGHTKNVYPEKSWSANFGDFYSFVQHMRDKAKQRDSDLLLVDTGDRRIGHGLTDHVLNPLKDFNGQTVSTLYLDLGYDLVVPGNHDLANPRVVKWTCVNFLLFYSLNVYVCCRMDTLVKLWHEKYLTSNVNRTNGDPLGARYRRWETPKGTKMLAFGVVPTKTSPPKGLLTIDPIDKMVERQWFKDAIRSDPKQKVDVFVLLGHPGAGDDMRLIHDAIRREHPLTPIMIFAGHTHQRWCRTFENEDGFTRSMLIQSGRYFDTVGWMTVNLDDNTIGRDLKFSRRFLDNNVRTYKYHTGTDKTNFHTEVGKAMTARIHEMEKSEELSKIYGELDSDYYLDRREWTEKETDKQSLFSFYLNAVENSLIDAKISPNWLFFSNWGILRGDIYKGPFTLSDLYAISPDDKSPFLSITVPRRIADQLVQKTREMERDEKTKNKNIIEPQLETLGAIEDESQSLFSLPSRNPSRPAGGLTYGWVTNDLCGSDGDDVPHKKIPKVDFEKTKSGLPVYFWRKNYKSGNLDEDAPVDIIVTNRIGQRRVPEALKELGIVVKSKLSSYREDVMQNNLALIYIQNNFPYKIRSEGTL